MAIDSSISIPNDTETVTVELTVKEAMALGQLVHYHADAGVNAAARKKVMRALERTIVPQTVKLDYFALDL